MKRFNPLLVGLVCLAPTFPALAENPKTFALKDGDRVVLIGDTLIERDQKYGFLETLLTLQNPDKSIIFRNLGWSGDTVFGDARAGFGTQADGFQHLKEHLLALKPTVVFVGYGMNESFEGEAGLPRFVSGLNTLLDVVAETKARVVLISPIAHEKLAPPLPDPAGHNRLLALYRNALRKTAEERHLAFIDVFEVMERYDRKKSRPQEPGTSSLSLTDDGIHLNELGYRCFAAVMSGRLKKMSGQLDRKQGLLLTWAILRHDGKIESVERTKVSRVETLPNGAGLKLEVTDENLPEPLLPLPLDVATERSLSVRDLPPGSYVLKIDGKQVAKGDQAAWDKGVHLQKGPEFDQVDRLRKIINEKNLLYFHRWRPQNETYLFGFRKHEQGNNAREIPLFDPLVDEKEKEIAKLRVPVTHVYELVRESEVGK